MAKFRCSICKADKDRDQFYNEPRTKRGCSRLCKPCRAKYYRGWADRNRVKAWLNGIRKRAKARGLDFDLVAEELIVPKKCPVLGITLAFGKSHAPNLPSLDRFDNSKGYTKDNVRVISYRANKLKNDATVEEFEAVLNYMKHDLKGNFGTLHIDI